MTRKITATAAVLALLATGCSASTDSSAPGGTLITGGTSTATSTPTPQLYYSCTRNHHRRPHPHCHRGDRLPERDGKHHRGIHHCGSNPDPDREP